MQTPQTKKIVINTATTIIVIGIVGTIYWTFFGDKENKAETRVSTEQVNQTVMVGFDIARTRRELEGLEKSIRSAQSIFDAPVFKDLENLSVRVQRENAGRDDPFVKTAWKISVDGQLTKGSAH